MDIGQGLSRLYCPSTPQQDYQGKARFMNRIGSPATAAVFFCARVGGHENWATLPSHLFSALRTISSHVMSCHFFPSLPSISYHPFILCHVMSFYLCPPISSHSSFSSHLLSCHFISPSHLWWWLVAGGGPSREIDFDNT